MWESSVFLVQPRLHPKGAGTQRPLQFWDLLPMRPQYEKNNQILHGYQITCEENVYTVNRGC